MRAEFPKQLSPENEQSLQKYERGLERRSRIADKIRKANLAIGKILAPVVMAANVFFAGIGGVGRQERVEQEEKTAVRLARLGKILPRHNVEYSLVKRVEYGKGEREEELGVVGFEKVGIPNEAFKEILATYPPGWVENVEAIGFAARELENDPRYGIPGGRVLAICVQSMPRSTIIFGKSSERINLAEFFKTAIHELTHANDFLTARLSPEAKLALLERVVLRLQSPDRFRSSYVDSINNPNPKTELYIKAVEYLAVIVEMYLDDPQIAKHRLPPEDLRIVLDLLERSASGYDAASNALLRRELIKKFYDSRLRADLQSIFGETEEGGKIAQFITQPENYSFTPQEQKNFSASLRQWERLMRKAPKRKSLNAVYGAWNSINVWAGALRDGDSTYEIYRERMETLREAYKDFVESFKELKAEDRRPLADYLKEEVGYGLNARLIDYRTWRAEQEEPSDDFVIEE